MLTVLLITLMIGQGQSWNEIGQQFITLFPENIAFYYPVDPVNSLNITALKGKTKVTVSVQDSDWSYQTTLTPGKPETVTLPPAVEEYRFGQTLRTVRIVGTNSIAVQSISQRGDSVQTNVLQPQMNLGKYFTIPSLNYTQMINTYLPSTRNVSMRYSSFRLVIINAENGLCSVSIVKNQTIKNYALQPFAALHLQMDGSESAVRTYYKAVVMLTHPCVETAECRCNMVVHQLFPDIQMDSRFVVPSIASISNAWLDVTYLANITASSLPSLQSIPQFINTAFPASLRLVGPGFIIETIPQFRFSACYLVYATSADAQALVIAETGLRDSVYIDGDLLSSTQWSTMADSMYSSVLVPLDGTHVIWHPSTLIAVSVLEKSTNIYGGAAICLSTQPDPLGCALMPSTFDVISIPQTWPASHQYCLVASDELFSPSNKAAQMEMVNILNSKGVNESLWIGLRRSLLTLDWYRQMGESEQELVYTQWGSGEPRDAVKGMCASVFPNSSMGFQWKNMQCCTPLMSVCYKRATYYPLYFPISDVNSSASNNDNENNSESKKLFT